MFGNVFWSNRRKFKDELGSADKIAPTITKINFGEKSFNPAVGFAISIMLGSSIWALLLTIISRNL